MALPDMLAVDPFRSLQARQVDGQFADRATACRHPTTVTRANSDLQRWNDQGRHKVAKKSANPRLGTKKNPARRRVLNPPAKAAEAPAVRKRPPDGGDRPEQWIIVTKFDSGDIAFWGETRGGASGLTPYRGNSYRYESESAALYEAYSLKERHELKDFHVERLPRPRKALPSLPPVTIIYNPDDGA